MHLHKYATFTNYDNYSLQGLLETMGGKDSNQGHFTNVSLR